MYKFSPLPFLVAATLALAACSPQDTATSAVAAKPAQPFEAVAAQGKGFTAGSMMSANAVYVLFDPQCPHCGHLWQASLPLQSKVKFVWIPVAIMNAKSAPQGAALLAAADPVNAMTEHEQSILAGTGGSSASANIPDELAQSIKANTALFNSLGVESVPYVLAKNLRTGQLVSRNGAMDTAALAEFIGLPTP
ncbi:thioredoxin fold domain-containing protein [Rhodoferax sp. PAMC 29310]|uniref:thioredoxin fold domain-containing protein n=1 Tax=Rhodoferax sp. PAMC 29310 TaxID=2822760 RepID=UPI001B326B38|nr:thioredoxin fold domain-containing protein [Rhodoferax sp. PAMC 29310]